VASTFMRGSTRYIRFKGYDGAWTQQATEYGLDDREKALELAEAMEARIAAGVKHADPMTGRVTLTRYFEHWIERRKKRNRSWSDDKGRIENHVLPALVDLGEKEALPLGEVEIEKIRPRHIREVFEALRDGGEIKIKTVHNVYGSTQALFAAAVLDDLISRSPCMLTSEHLGAVLERDTKQAEDSIYPREHVVRLRHDEERQGAVHAHAPHPRCDARRVAVALADDLRASADARRPDCPVHPQAREAGPPARDRRPPHEELGEQGIREGLEAARPAPPPRA
jgi:hypothetical protein